MGGSFVSTASEPSVVEALESPLRVGLIGTGVISDQYLASMSRLPQLRLVAVADLDMQKAATVASAASVEARSVDDLLASADVDVVLNLTVPAAHVDVSIAALLAGKHVYVEKPLALQLAEGRGVLELARSRGLRVGSAPDTVLGTGIQTARDVIDRGEIGEPIGATANWTAPGHELWHPAPKFYYQPGGGPLFDMGPYYLTSLVTLLGPVVTVSAAASRSDRTRLIATGPQAGTAVDVDIDTHVAAILHHAGGAISTVLLSFEVWGSNLPRIEVFGTAGSVSVPDPNIFDGTVQLLDTSRTWRNVPDSAGFLGAGRGYGLAEMAVAIDEGRGHRASGDMAMHVLDIMESITSAAEYGETRQLTTTVERPAAVAHSRMGALAV
ncbi:putative dehydrogenase [Conyzicola nivalis]|uniref:Dehydrogenase n=1 Tax=Conyzicola nivalis TaxID=1477021 RepID=A0ABV2QPL7_9MICO